MALLPTARETACTWRSFEGSLADLCMHCHVSNVTRVTHGLCGIVTKELSCMDESNLFSAVTIRFQLFRCPVASGNIRDVPLNVP